MPKVKNLIKAPIKEAQLLISFDSGQKLERCEAFFENIKDDFQEKKKFYLISHTVNFDESESSENSSKHKHIGFRYQSEDKQKVLAYSTDNFVFSKIESYGKWEDFFTEYKNLFEQIPGGNEEIKVKQIGTRFINSINLPYRTEIDKYFSLLPVISSDDFSSNLNNLFLRYNISEPSGMKAAINLYINGVDKGESFELILDISTYIDKIYELKSNEIESDFERLRAYKNDIFFNCITDKLIEEYLDEK